MKVLYVRNLTATVTEEKLQEVFEEHGKVDRVKKIEDYAFVHFQDHDKAVVAMNALNHNDLLGANLEISLAEPLFGYEVSMGPNILNDSFSMCLN